jgi:nicotinamide riboside kinase
LDLNLQKMPQRSGQITFTGVESSGKTTLSRRLADATGWPLLPELARTDPAVLAGHAGPADLERLLLTQHAQALRHAPHRPVLCDTGAVVLSIWSEVRFNHPLPQAQAIARSTALYVLTAPDLPWEPDPLRSSPSLAERLELHDRYLHRLADWDLPYVLIRGNALEGRFQQAVTALRGSGFAISE